MELPGEGAGMSRVWAGTVLWVAKGFLEEGPEWKGFPGGRVGPDAATPIDAGGGPDRGAYGAVGGPVDGAGGGPCTVVGKVVGGKDPEMAVGGEMGDPATRLMPFCHRPWPSPPFCGRSRRGAQQAQLDIGVQE